MSDRKQRARLFSALSDPTRLHLVEALSDGAERTGKELAEQVGITLALVCHHTAILHQAGLLEKRKQGQSCLHRLQPGCLAELSAQLGTLAFRGEARAAEKPGP